MIKMDPTSGSPKADENQNPALLPEKSFVSSVPEKEPGFSSGDGSGEKQVNSGGSKKKLLFVFGGLFLLAAGLTGAVLLTGRTQETRKEAANANFNYCKGWNGGPVPSEHWSHIYQGTTHEGGTYRKIYHDGNVNLQWRNVYWCDYEQMVAKGKTNACEESDSGEWLKNPQKDAVYNTGYTQTMEELIEQSHYEGNCQIIQVDVTGCPNDSKGNNWDGQVAFVVYVNDYCPEPTPTPTTPVPTPTVPEPTPTVPEPTPTEIPEPTITPTITGVPPSLSCEYCRVYNEDWQEIPISALSTLQVGEQIYLATRGQTEHAQGITKARFRVTVNSNQGAWQETTQQRNSGEFYIAYTIGASGTYKVESMVYNPDLGWE